MANPTVAQALETARRHHTAGDLRQAELGYRQILAQDPRQPDALYFLGLLAHQVGQRESAVLLIQQAIGIRPTAEYLSNLGFILRELGQIDEAIAACSDAVRLKPDAHEAYNNLGFALEGAGRMTEAIAAFENAARLKPDWPLPLRNVGNALRSQHRFAEAVDAYRRVLAITGPDAIALNDLGVVLQANHQLDEAATAFRESIRLAPTIPELHNNLGNVLQDAGRIDEAIACFREAIRLRPDFAVAHSNLVYAMHFDPECDPAALLEEHRNWARMHAEPLTAAVPALVVRGPKERRLRIGYVSRDLHDHPVGCFLLQVLESHNREQFEIVCYYDGNASDDVHRRLRAASDVWHATGHLSDAHLAEVIRGHGVDVLFDLAAHAPGNRLLAFARKPAPIQVTYLGYPGTTGMSAMDVRITDPHLDPPGASEAFYSERSIRPASNYWCYGSMPGAPDVGDLPARRNGHVTFGCLNNFGKTNPLVLQMWCRLLEAVPESRILLHAHPGRHRDDVSAMLKEHGVDPARLEFVGGQSATQYLETYNRIDISMDPFPYHGGTTTCDALWMGVPVVSLAGQLAVHRAGVSLLSNVGLPELIARTPDEYVRIAADLARDLPRLDDIRRTLRERMRRSPLCDAKSFTSGLEDLLRQIWRERVGNGG